MALRIAIIEDEPATARNLQFLLQELNPSIEVLTTLGSVKATVEWLKENATRCQLLFMDIRLSDGLSLDIFSQIAIDVPVVFVTAYNDYALQAFKANGIDYILKPFDESELQQALQRYHRLTGKSASPQTLSHLAENIRAGKAAHRQSFLVHFRDKLLPLTIADIGFFSTAEDTCYAHTLDNKKYIVEFTLEQLIEQLDPALFFRVNRQYIIQRKAIKEIAFYFNGRLLLKTEPESGDKMLISKARTPEFKDWMNS